ncbi:TCP-1/cpn60 chaperonin family protein [Candidatus Bathyarchaeota archaeon]|jgi:thermosome|nr:TCP-1/cpn60 chaperonin family protein [Candidatus Bathyarchaeota archaeon]
MGMEFSGQSGQRILILKEGSSRRTGKDVQTSNIAAAKIVADVVKATLGPRGMDKMLVDTLGDATISNDGHEILKEIDVQHPAAKMIVEVSKTQDDQVGDGTTTAVILAGELLNSAQDLLDKGIHPTLIVAGYRKAADEALRILDKVAVTVDLKDRETLKKIAITSMRGKVIGTSGDHFSDIAIDAVLQVAEEQNGKMTADKDDIQLVKKVGKSLIDTELIQGIIVDKEVVHPDMPKRVDDAKIALLDSALEIEKTEMDSEIRIRDPLKMRAFLDEESTMLQNMVKKIVNSGANVLICQKGIDDMAQHFLARAGILAVRRIKASDMEKLAKATGGKPATTLDDLTGDDLGYAKLVEERKIGEDKLVFIEGCKNAKAVSILIRAGLERLVDEAERSLNDALYVVVDIVKDNKIVAGGGAIEEELAKRIRSYAATVGGREQLAIERFADSLEIIPTTLTENAGLNTIDVLVAIRSAHEKADGLWMGLNAFTGEITDMMKEGVIEPLSVKVQAIKSAVEASSMILRIDDVIASSKAPPMPPKGGMPGY